MTALKFVSSFLSVSLDKEAIAEIKAANADKMESLYAEISRLKDEIRELDKSKSASDTAKDDDTQ